ncbi:tetratricopeptide repeat protein [Lactiplantibacillus plajomi]|uniref:Tetratricopeptide repeat protein n=1 Tax=Lactiplantibacillus plajomi TaxID=1457217 RepID=A0ABV6K175_9LACO|nr:tetratricopeptide repeat protein [Lactiplantibacillus plajomi]
MSYSEKMLAALSSGQLETAKKHFAWALRKDDDDTLFSLAEELYGLGFLKQSARTYKKLLAKYPDEDDLKTGLADVAIDEGDTDLALDYLHQVKPDSPAYVQALLVEADLYQTQELFEVSEQKLIEAYKLAPDEPIVAFALAEFYFLIRNYNKAINFYLNLIKRGHLEISRVNLVERLGVSYAEAGRFEQAVGYLEQIKPAKLTPDSRFELGFTYLQLNEPRKAIDTFNKLREQDSQYASVYPYLAEAQEQLHQLDAALLTLQEGLAVDQYNEQLYLRTARLALKLDDQELAEKYLREGLSIDPDNLTTVLELSNLLVQRERFQDNVDLLDQYLQSNEFDPQFYWNLAVSNDQLDNFKAAKENYLAAYPFFEHNEDFLKPAIYFFREAGMAEQAVAALRNYLEIVPEDGEMVAMLEDYEDQGY